MVRLIPLVAFLMCFAECATAELTVTVQDALLEDTAASRTGSFEVFVDSDEPTPPELIGFQLRLRVEPAEAGLTLTGIEPPDDHRYVFPGQSPSGTVRSDGEIVEGGDFLTSGSWPLHNGSGLIRVNFEVADGVGSGSYDLLLDNAESFLTTAGFADLPFEVREGRVLVDPLVGDYSGNGLVEQSDLDLVLGNWGADGSTPPAGWINDPPDGIIDQSELDGVLANWGATPGLTGGASSVPEPASWLLALGGLASCILLFARASARSSPRPSR